MSSATELYNLYSGFNPNLNIAQQQADMSTAKMKPEMNLAALSLAKAQATRENALAQKTTMEAQDLQKQLQIGEQLAAQRSSATSRLGALAAGDDPSKPIMEKDGQPTKYGVMTDSAQELKAAQAAEQDLRTKAQAYAGTTKGSQYQKDFMAAQKATRDARTAFNKQAQEFSDEIGTSLTSVTDKTTPEDYQRILENIRATGAPLPNNLPPVLNAQTLPAIKQAGKGMLSASQALKLQEKELERERMAAQEKEAVAREERFNRSQERMEARARESADRADRRLALAEDRLTGKKMSAEQARMQRPVNALGGVASTLESLNEFSSGTSVGILPSMQTKDGMINAVRNIAGRKITSTESDQMNTLFKGIGRNLAAIETSGLATGLAELSKSLESGVYIQAGKDGPYEVALKLADIRRIAEENIKPAIESESLTGPQAETAKKLIERITKAIPYSTIDVIKATRQAQGKTGPTIGEATKKAVGGSSGWSIVK